MRRSRWPVAYGAASRARRATRDSPADLATARMSEHAWDAVVIGAGPNGLAAAIALAQAGRSVLVLEAEATLGGGARTAELTLPGFRHDICSTIQPLGVSSPFFSTLPLAEHGLEWVYPEAAL